METSAAPPCKFLLTRLLGGGGFFSALPLNPTGPLVRLGAPSLCRGKVTSSFFFFFLLLFLFLAALCFPASPALFIPPN